MQHDLDIPAFLRVTDQQAHNASWKGKHVRSCTGHGEGSGWRWQFPKGLTDAECRAELRRQAKAEKEKRDARFALLRELAAERKVKAVRR